MSERQRQSYFNVKTKQKGSDLQILQSQVLPLASTIDSKLRPFSSDCREDPEDALDCQVNVDVQVCAENRTETQQSQPFYEGAEDSSVCCSVLLLFKGGGQSSIRDLHPGVSRVTHLPTSLARSLALLRVSSVEFSLPI